MPSKNITATELTRRMRGHLSVMDAYPNVPHTASTMGGLRQTLDLAISHLAGEAETETPGDQPGRPLVRT